MSKWARLCIIWTAVISDDKWNEGHEWHLEFKYAPDLPCPFPIVPAGTRPKHDAVGHLTADGRVHVFNSSTNREIPNLLSSTSRGAEGFGSAVQLQGDRDLSVQDLGCGFLPIDHYQNVPHKVD